ncbi:hypothetical protein VNI00_009951 [Paramarasmius palmivorus]|uniref:Acyl-CoA dehydrogenase NM domain-like protein n=1 Tax=Paramarasmius palmivorus TaxID=297713 RepID=A0AAW0CPN9_9AGAR
MFPNKTAELTRDDIVNLTPKYWAIYSDPILAMASDCAVATLLAIQYNLCVGTLAMHDSNREDVAALIEKLLRFEIVGLFCLSEIGHGLNAINLETSATLQSNGDFVLETPVKGAAKYMPPTSPCGIPTVAVVFARLIVDQEDRGVKPFIVQMNDGHRMNENIICQVLPPRGGSRPIKHAITYFNRVCLPATALLGTTDRGKDRRIAFFEHIYRVPCGAMTMGTVGVVIMRTLSYIAGRYSLRRMVADAFTGKPRAIINFSTQYIPVLVAVAQTLVMETFTEFALSLFMEAREQLLQRHLIATIYKTSVLQLALPMPINLGDRCGAQGLYEVNQFSGLHADIRGAAIAEGDILVTSIRFGVDVILGRIQPPDTTDPNSLLYRHERAMIKELRELLVITSGHRDPRFEQRALPRCQALVAAIGYRLAYESAVASKLDQRILATCRV